MITLGKLPTTATMLYEIVEAVVDKTTDPDVVVPLTCYLLNQISRQVAFGRSNLSFSLRRIQSILEGAADSTVYRPRTDYRVCDISNASALLSEKFREVLADPWISEIPDENVYGMRSRLFVPGTMLFSQKGQSRKYATELLSSSILRIPPSTKKDLLQSLRDWKGTFSSTASDGGRWAKLVSNQNRNSEADEWRGKRKGGLIGVQPHADTLVLPYAISQLMIPKTQSIRDPSVARHPSVQFCYSLAADCKDPVEWGDFHFIPFSHFGDNHQYPSPDILICTKELAEERLGQEGDRYALAKIELEVPDNQKKWEDISSPLRLLYRPVEPFDVDYLSNGRSASLTGEIRAVEADQFHLPVAWISSAGESRKGEPYFRFSMIGSYSDTAVEAFNRETGIRRIRLIESELFDEGLSEFFSYEEQRILVWYFSRLEFREAFLAPTSDGYTWALDAGLCLGMRDQHRISGVANDVQSYRFYGAGGRRINPLCVAVRCRPEHGPQGQLAWERSERLANALASLCSDFRRQMGAFLGTEDPGQVHRPMWQSGNTIQQLRCAMLRIFGGTHGVRSGILHSMTAEGFVGNVAFPNSFYRRKARWAELLGQVLQQQDVHPDEKAIYRTG